MSLARNQPRGSGTEAAGWRHAWVRFWFTPSDPFGLHVLRVLTAALMLAWLAPLAGHVDDFLGLGGWVDVRAYQELSPTPNDPGMIDPRGWSLLFLLGENPTLLHACYWGVVAAAGLYLLGLFVRPISIVMWVAAASFSANPIIEIDTDVYLRIATFYLMIGYVFMGQSAARLPWWRRLLAPTDYFLFRRPDLDVPGSTAATVALRLWQIHFALLIVVSGLHKLQLPEWWTGVALWYIFNPAATATPESLTAWSGPRFTINISMMSLAAYAMLAWQIMFPAFAWRAGWGRWLLLGGAAVGALGLLMIFPIPLLGPTFFVACLGFVAHEDAGRWRLVLERLWPAARRLPGNFSAATAGIAPTAAASAGRR